MKIVSLKNVKIINTKRHTQTLEIKLGDLYIHTTIDPESYKLFLGINDIIYLHLIVRGLALFNGK